MEEAIDQINQLQPPIPVCYRHLRKSRDDSLAAK